MDSTPAQKTAGDAPQDVSWGRIRESLVALLSNLKRLQTQLDDEEIKLTPITRARVLERWARILILVQRAKKSIDEADLQATEENLDALVIAARQFLEESGAG